MKAALLLLTLGAALFGSPPDARADELRDPMRPPAPAARAEHAPAREAGPVLSAVLAFQGRRSAIFNGRLVHEGSVIGPYTIESVLEDGVRYRNAGLTHELHLPHPESPIKKPAAEPARTPSGESP